MHNKSIIIISGKKQSGKSSLSKAIFVEYLNNKVEQKRFILDKSGKYIFVVDTFNNKVLNLDYPNDDTKKIYDSYGVKIYSFADPMKKICIDLFGLHPRQVYGSDSDKNSKTHISWDRVPESVVEQFCKNEGLKKRPNGFLSSRQFMQCLGTEIIRFIDENAHARALYAQIAEEKYNLCIINDARFPNEISIGNEHHAKTIRLLRKPEEPGTHNSETALDDFPHGEFSLVFDNNNMTMSETHKRIMPTVLKWLAEAKLL